MMSNSTQGAISSLETGCILHSDRRFTEALVHYEKGFQLLMVSMKYMTDPVMKEQILHNVEEYMTRAEKLKQYVKTKKEEGKYHEQIKIEDNTRGNSYGKVFGRFLNEAVYEIKIEDPYVRSFYQCQNFLRFCELAVKSCSNLERIFLTTTKDTSPKDKEQENLLEKIRASLFQHKVTLLITFSSTLHDRQIILSSGWNIKIGRGLDYFKAPENNIAIGSCDMDLRRCHETVVDVFHNSAVRLA